MLKIVIQKKCFSWRSYFIVSEIRFDRKQRKNNVRSKVFLFCKWSKKKGCVDINTALFCEHNVLEIPYSKTRQLGFYFPMAAYPVLNSPSSMTEILFLHETIWIASDKKTCLLFKRYKNPQCNWCWWSSFFSYLVTLYLLPSIPITIKWKL